MREKWRDEGGSRLLGVGRRELEEQASDNNQQGCDADHFVSDEESDQWNSEDSLNQHGEAGDQDDRFAQPRLPERGHQNNDCEDEPTPGHREKRNFEDGLHGNRQIRCTYGWSGDLQIREAMYGGRREQDNATQREQCARCGTASNHLNQSSICMKNAVVVAKRRETTLRA